MQGFDIGTIMGEGKKRLGWSSAPSIDAQVAAPLQASGKLAAEAAAKFGRTVEKVLVKHGKQITEEQFVVNKMAQSTIDIFGMFVVLSRATRSINNKNASSEHEANLANLFCIEAARRVDDNLRDAVDPY